MKIGIYPSKQDRDKNSFFSMTERCLNDAGIDVEELSEAIGDDLVEYLYLHFFENISPRSIFFAWMNYAKKIAFLAFVKLKKKKIIVAIHNKQPHDLKYAFLSRSLLKILLNDAVAIVGLSKATYDVLNDICGLKSLKERLYIIPHPAYEVLGAYDNSERETICPKEKMLVLFAGRIRKYKNIELVIRLAKEHLNDSVLFYIAGECQDESYLTQLTSLIRSVNNIHIETRFFKEKELQELVNACDLMIMPYDKRSSLNSGAMYLAMSMGKTVICPDIGSAKDVPGDLIYMYSYDELNPDSHYSSLEQAYMNAYSDFINCRTYDIGCKCADYVNTFHSRSIVAQKYKELFCDMERNAE